MGRPPAILSMLGLPPLRDWWREMRREEREAAARRRALRKASDQARPKCCCEAYPWPHRPAGGLCRFPEPPLERWQPKPKPGGRPYRGRYAGLFRQIACANGLHPIRDRAAIQALLPGALALAKATKRQRPSMRFCNVEITAGGVRIHLPGCGPNWTRGE